LAIVSTIPKLTVEAQIQLLEVRGIAPISAEVIVRIDPRRRTSAAGALEDKELA
jgi:hypothetical protein